MSLSFTMVESRTPIEYRVERWTDQRIVDQTEYSAYWNDLQFEREKVWFVTGDDYSRMEDYLHSSGMLEDLDTILKLVLRITGHGLHGKGIDLAAGNCWAVPPLLAEPAVQHVYALKFSEHRLMQMGLSLLRHYQIQPASVTPVLGTFYDLKLADRSIAFALLSAALHHADHPERLLSEVGRVLEPGGLILVIGERDVDGWTRRARHFAAALVANLVPSALQCLILGRTLKPRPWAYGHFPADPVLGDHDYTLSEYRVMFDRAHLEVLARFRGRTSRCHGFLLRNALAAG
jgi:SAM-dependent methyltransferase